MEGIRRSIQGNLNGTKAAQDTRGFNHTLYRWDTAAEELLALEDTLKRLGSRRMAGEETAVSHIFINRCTVVFRRCLI
jgi:hypothetical protein